ncbi:MAG TPA: hypothetical protein VFN10_16595 [Thermoanaerobaculia bacterium]|nr:hypothetical protein [Thermoanaerobaculia bacterium]
MAVFNLFFASILLPLIGIALLARRTRIPLAGWIATFLLSLGLTSFSFFTAPWGWFGIAPRYILGVLFLLALAVSLIRKPPEEPGSETPLAQIVKVVIALFFGGVAIGALQGRSVPPGAVDFAFPLRHGTYLVEHGGSTPPTNIYAAIQQQHFAVDLVKLNAWGMRAHGIVPSDPKAFAIYGEPVYAPCDGSVSAIAANIVTLQCGDLAVHLAPLSAVSVKPKSPIAKGTLLGNAGVILHLYAQRGNDAVPMTFGGRWLVRNETVRVP